MTDRIIRDRSLLRIVRQSQQGPSGAGVVLADTATVACFLAGTDDLLADLTDMQNNAIPNPFTVLQAGGSKRWGVQLPVGLPVELYHVEGQDYLDPGGRVWVLGGPRIYAADPTVEPVLIYDVLVTAALSPTGYTVGSTDAFNVVFSEDVSGVDINSLVVSDGTNSPASVAQVNASTYTVNPPAGGWIEGATLTIRPATSIVAVADTTRTFAGHAFVLHVSGADTEAPVMTAFVCEATSTDANIAISSLSATDNVGVDSYQVNESATPPSPAVGTWQSASYWTTNGYDTGEGAGYTGTKTLYAWAKDATGNVSTSLSDSCALTIPSNLAPTFTSQPTESSVTTSSITGAYGTSDTEGDHYLLESSTDDGSTWQTEVADEIPGAGKTVTITTLSSDGVTPLSSGTSYTWRLRLTALTGNTTPVVSNNVTSTTDALTIDIAWPPGAPDAWNSVRAGGASTFLAAQSFITPGTISTIDAVNLNLRRPTGYAGTGNLLIELVTDSAGNPEGTVLGSTTMTWAEITAAVPTLDTFYASRKTFGTPVSVSASTTYWLRYSITTPSGDCVVQTGVTTGDPYASGVDKYDTGSGWTLYAGYDMQTRIEYS